MYGRILFTFTFSLLLALLLTTVSAGTQPSLDNFTLSDYNQKQHSLADYSDSKAVVLIFISTRCPVSNAYNERMEKLFQDYSKKGVTFLGINANSMEDIKEIKQHAGEKKLFFTILKDENNIIADKLNASVTPETFVLDPQGVILYHGRIDDAKDESNVKSPDLKNALDQILAGRKVTTAETKVFGCVIKRVEKE